MRIFLDADFRSPFFGNWRRVLACTLVCAAAAFAMLLAALSSPKATLPELKLADSLCDRRGRKLLVLALTIMLEREHDGDFLGADVKAVSSSEILHDLESFRQMGSVLYIAAHPDDENTELLSYLSRGRDYRTAYLSLTRGDGGQNILGPDLGEKLGVARTQELLAARIRWMGRSSFFSRMIDFGFSKNYAETLNIWNKERSCCPTWCRVPRRFRPDILITRFSPVPGGTHGHHTASAVLALEAFKLAGDAKAFPDQGLTPWQPKRIFWNVSTYQKR